MATVSPPLGAPQGMPATAAAPTSPLPGQPLAPSPHPDLQKPPVPAGSVAVNRDELDQLRMSQARLAEIEALAQQQEIEEMQAKFGKLATDDPQRAIIEQREYWEKEANKLKGEKAELETRWLGEKCNYTINSALAGVAFAGDTPEERAEAAQDLRELIAKDFHAVRNALGEIEVREKVSGRPAAEVLHERLAGRRYARFLAPSSRGGSGSDGTRSLAQPAQPPSQLTDFQRQQAQYIQSRQGGFGGQYPGQGLRPRTA